VKIQINLSSALKQINTILQKVDRKENQILSKKEAHYKSGLIKMENKIEKLSTFHNYDWIFDEI
jgi:hypothetical protein